MTEKSTAKAAFQITGWDENPYGEFESPRKLTRAATTQEYTGELAGASTATLLLYYGAADAPVYYTGMEHFDVTVAGRAGTFVAQQQGTFTDGVAETTWFVVPGSGTGDLAGLRGEGGYRAGQGEPDVTLTFDYHFQA